MKLRKAVNSVGTCLKMHEYHNHHGRRRSETIVKLEAILSDTLSRCNHQRTARTCLNNHDLQRYSDPMAPLSILHWTVGIIKNLVTPPI